MGQQDDSTQKKQTVLVTGLRGLSGRMRRGRFSRAGIA